MENLVWLHGKIPPGSLTYNYRSVVPIPSFCLSKLAVTDVFLEEQTKLVKSLANLSY